MNNYVSNKWLSVRKIASKYVLPTDTRNIRHFHTEGFEILAFANEDVGRNIWLTGKFEPEETAYFASQIKPEDTCFDVGGNVGFMSMLFAKHAHRGHVHAFEPIALNASLIATNARLNNFDNITINNVAVSDKEGTVQFSVSVDSAYSSMIATGRKENLKQVEIPALTLDDYAIERAIKRVDILKVDVEGAEALVVAGAQKILSDKGKKPRLVLLELYDVNLKPFGSSVLELVERMKSLGYAGSSLSDGKLVPFTPRMANTMPNIFFTLAD